jgi:hypothetical protein
MEKSTFTNACLSGVRAVMSIMRVPVVELLHQAMMGQLPVFKYLLSGMRGDLWLCLVMPDIKCHCFSRTRL